ncbi:DUF6192 family protein [Kitasatospora griseola]|uniref:DUF6192 family protein n=1 Tax=Kitasatospora griseola TaxID=2064 RepID=UPI00342F7A65
MRESGGGQALANEMVGLSYTSVKDTRWTASRRPKDRRQPKASFTVHRILAGTAGEGKRFEATLTPPEGKSRWTADETNRRVSRQVEVTTALLRRPDVAARTMADGTARRQVNHAQVERGRQAREHFEENSPLAPTIRQIDRSVEFLDPVTACHAFVAAAGRVVPGLSHRRQPPSARSQPSAYGWSGTASMPP